MSDQVLQFYGSDEDLSELRKALSAAGLQEHEDNAIHCSQHLIPHSIAFVAGVGVGKCIRVFLQTRGKRMVSDGEQRITIKGDFSATEIERLLKIPYNLNIEDEEGDAKQVGQRSQSLIVGGEKNTMTKRKQSSGQGSKSIKKRASRSSAYRYRDFPISPVTDPKTHEIVGWRVSGHGEFATTEQAEICVDQRISQIEGDVQGRI